MSAPWAMEEHELSESFVCSVYDEHGDVVAHHLTRERGRLIAAAPDLLKEHDIHEGDLFLLRRAIEEGDPKAELLNRVDTMLAETRAILAKARGQ